MRKKIPVGISDFKQIIEGSYYFIDKTLFIKELLDSGRAVTLFPRPRRFGKTLNLSMLRYFFEKSSVSNRHLFNGLSIEQHPECMAHQGNYPVIFLSFKDAKHSTWELCYALLKQVIAEEFRRHNYLLKSNLLDETQRKAFLRIMEGSAEVIEYLSALKILSAHLHAFYGKRVIILIDEYDAGIYQGFMNNYYSEIISFMRNFLSAGLKDNSQLFFAVLTGILRVAKESIFSGLNNLSVRGFLQESYSSQFGLLEREVSDMLAYFDMPNLLESVRRWYDGYQSGLNKLYNPWSIVNLVDNGGVEQPYWVNTSDNAIISHLLEKSDSTVKEELELLVRGVTLRKVLNEGITLLALEKESDALWNFLFMSGYLTFENYRQHPVELALWEADLKIPNIEVAAVYRTTFLSWFEKSVHFREYQTMLKNLVLGNIAEFKELFSTFTIKALSVYDIAENEPERLYHMLVLGMLVGLQATHELRSNRESGRGRYDVMLIPHDKKQPGIIIEFKKVNKDRHETIEGAAQNALRQIDERRYEVELHTSGVANVIKLGIAFEGKETLILDSRELQNGSI